MIEIRTLGRTSVAVNGEPLTGEAAWPKSLALIVYMAREPGPDRREEILGVLWPDREEKRARRALNQLLYTLRKTSPELDLESVSGAIDFGREVKLDVEEFERLLEAGDLAGAVALYEGPFLVDVRVDAPEFDHWADRQRADLARKFRKAALQLAMEAKERGDCDSAVALCRRLVDADPLDDEPQHMLIECLHLRGDRVAALRQFDTYRELLAQELDVEPLDHTRELVARIRGELAPEEAAVEPQIAAEAGEEAEPAPPRRDTWVPLARPPRPGARTWLGRGGLVGLVALAVALALTVWLWPRGGPEVHMDDAAGDLATGARIAVLPFSPHGMGTDDEGLPVGVAQLLSVQLEQRGVVETIAHRAVLRHWGESDLATAGGFNPSTLKSLAEALGASGVVLGDLHVSGDELWIVAELLDPRTGLLLMQADVRGPRDSRFDLITQLADSLFARMDVGTDNADAR